MWDCDDEIVYFFLTCQLLKCFKVWRPNLDLVGLVVDGLDGWWNI